MTAIRLRTPGVAGLVSETVETPPLGSSEALVEVHAAAITRGELEWPLDRLPAIPSYELSGVIAAVGAEVDTVAVGEAVFALTPFDRDGVAAAYAAVPTSLLAAKPSTLDHLASAAVPLPALSAWQGLFDHGRLEAGERVLIHGAGGGVGQFATQLARRRGAHVLATVTGASGEAARALGAHETIDGRGSRVEEAVEPVDLVFDTVGGELLASSHGLLRKGGRLVSIAEEPAAGSGTYFVVEPNREELSEIARLVDAGELRVVVDSVFPLADARAAFERSLTRGKRGKVVLRVRDEAAT
jgi:NADPH:quinone reductase-like Zn-dependent oxidoreductase